MELHDIVPDADLLMAMEPEELAKVILKHVKSLPESERRVINPQGLFSRDRLRAFQSAPIRQLRRALMVAWGCLVRDGLLAGDPDETPGAFFFLTRRGEGDERDVETYLKANLLPRQLLHAKLALKIWPAFSRGDYETAVFQSFKEVEVAVREAGGFAPTDLGTCLMRKAFGPQGGLADSTLPVAEQEAIAHLFAGAIGSYKNPGSHRNMPFDDPSEAVELIFFASHLLRIVDRAKASHAPTMEHQP